MNLFDNPVLIYLRAMLAVRIHRARTADRGLGVSAIEWAIITGMLAAIALTVYGVVRTQVGNAANNISTQYEK
ncbi:MULTISPECIES: hypothetical protein [Thermomonospora]|uniref:Flp/Fap pilin component n=1 Tax=Thermomonospora curvata (strain ATCC 19995 / DSM 43183 / JCM 3096 / KCTC 9072 / NBRC 15933 / NCIMB 10081 / Henssen B9) TaxID=471852 RepID=D1A214_THECD|nr:MULTISPECIES: hypothetical protein [Thermomonospora]ACY99667.1 hypothetical protein Tcur_4139 [Thermomonospora curvata DSM 43183]PKK12688.1 MAG: hypothetical protein BUE48_020310 [Thermomonospora sp. CIF 1]